MNVSEITDSEAGVAAALQVLENRYEYDGQGRIVGALHDGGMPRFLFARFATGCLWRFRSDLAGELVRGVAKLAGREPGLLGGAEDYFAGGTPQRPERLVMIERLFADSPGGRGKAAPDGASHEWVIGKGGRCAELWRID